MDLKSCYIVMKYVNRIYFENGVNSILKVVF